MKIYNINYKISSKDNNKYIVLSDFHGYFSLKLANYVNEINAKYVIITGDILNGYNWNKTKKVEKFKKFIDIISKNHKVIISFGNHDLWGINNTGYKNFRNLKNENVYPILNESIIIDNDLFTSFVPNKTCYNYFTQNKKSTINKIVKCYEKLPEIPNGKYVKHLVSHNPYHFYHKEMVNIISDKYDVVYTGHFHDGWIPTKYINKNYDKIIDKGLHELLRNIFLRTKPDKTHLKLKRILSRGLVYMYTDGYYVLLPNNKVFYYNKFINDYHMIKKSDLNNRLHEQKVPALVCAGAVNTFLRLKFFYPHVTTIVLTDEKDIHEGKIRIE